MCRNYIILPFVLYGCENQLFILKEECKTQVYNCCKNQGATSKTGLPEGWFGEVSIMRSHRF
jgi:hypothetical protein